MPEHDPSRDSEGVSRGPLAYALGLPGPLCIGQVVVSDAGDVLLCIGKRASASSYTFLGAIRLSEHERGLLRAAIAKVANEGTLNG